MSSNKDETDSTTTDTQNLPPPHLLPSTRRVLVPNFKDFKPKEIRIPSAHAIKHVAFSCDGKKLSGVGMDKVVRVWATEKIDSRGSASMPYNAHYDEATCVAWNPTHPEIFCSCSAKDRRILFWDGRQNRPTQVYHCKSAPIHVQYSPDAMTLMYISTGSQLYFLRRHPELELKEQWKAFEIESARQDAMQGSTALFNHAGNALLTAKYNAYSLRLHEFPTMKKLSDDINAHNGGVGAIALDPRGRFIATGGQNSIINLFSTSTLICENTITCCEHSVKSIGFSHDGEFLAIANAGDYIDICATETGEHLHRIKLLGPAEAVVWHPSSLGFAYCYSILAQSSQQPYHGVIGLFGIFP
ncbi:WD40 repeat-like protein [Flagelloscypha sp. PMI_526]|nr:WD40 repeat-like protein [Flagelloscypha sp. PMI_526]